MASRLPFLSLKWPVLLTSVLVFTILVNAIWMKNKLVLISIVRILRTVKIIIVINILNRKQAIQALTVIE